MASNKFFTIMVVPEKSQKVVRLVIPSWFFKGGILTLAFLTVLALIMVLDYANVMNQINENKQLKVENRQLKQSVQVFKNKMVTIESTLDRVKTFVTKLRIITNIEDTPTSPLNAPVPGQPGSPGLPATLPNIPGPAAPSQEPVNSKKHSSLEKGLVDPTTETQSEPAAVAEADPLELAPPMSEEELRVRRQTLLASLMESSEETLVMSDADNSQFVKREFEKLDDVYDEVNRFSLATEQETQDILERLGEKRTLLASTPTRLPTNGYITSEYGVRINPYEGRTKMHEGIDIANRYGADVIAPADGVVVFSGVKPGYGKIIIIDHGNGLETRFAHSSKIMVANGEKVRRGQRIAAVGNTGHSTGPHCHYEVHANGLPVDPCDYILDNTSVCSRRVAMHQKRERYQRRGDESVDTE